MPGSQTRHISNDPPAMCYVESDILPLKHKLENLSLGPKTDHTHCTVNVFTLGCQVFKCDLSGQCQNSSAHGAGFLGM